MHYCTVTLSVHLFLTMKSPEHTQIRPNCGIIHITSILFLHRRFPTSAVEHCCSPMSVWKIEQSDKGSVNYSLSLFSLLLPMSMSKKQSEKCLVNYSLSSVLVS